jgi:DNA polymerase III epsilon subunit family exonuclease
MRKHNFAFIDIETTGLNLLSQEIIEIGCVLATESLEVIEEFELKIKPEHIENADTVALRVNHYDPSGWKDAQSLKDAMKIFSEKVKNCIMVGHNVAFDAGFLEFAFNKTKIVNTMHYHKLDTVSIAWAKMHKNKNMERFSLHELGKYFGIKNKNAHTALSDARTTFLLYKKLMELK